MKELIHVKKDHVDLEGMLNIPPKAQGLVLFAHGSGSSRLSPRNNYVANILNESGLATLLIDLLSEREDEIYKTRFDIDLLSDRLLMVIDWIDNQSETKQLSLGLFGSSTGAAAALQVAAALGDQIKAVVSRGGRPDLAMPVLNQVLAPTLLIVGEQDFGVIELNEKAFAKLNCTKQLKFVPNATHLFEEPGCLEVVSGMAKDWFQAYLVGFNNENT